ncbi:kelch-like protein 24 [Branchiostoma floridae x Branchiostoma belcheri]
MTIDMSSSQERHLLKELMRMRDEEVMTDVTLCVDGRELHCHRCVLVTCSQYFRLMFTMDMAEHYRKEVPVYGVSYSTLEQIVNFAYTGKVEFQEIPPILEAAKAPDPRDKYKTTIEELLSAADMFQILNLRRACAKYIMDKLNVDNCVKFYFFASLHNCDDLKKSCKELIEDHFILVSQKEEFLDLDQDQVSELLASDDLNVQKEEDVYEAALRWIKHLPQSRAESAPKLIKEVRLTRMDRSYLDEQLATDELLSSSPECVSFIEQAGATQVLDDSSGSACSVACKDSPRHGMKEANTIFIIGGKQYTDMGDIEYCSTCFCFDPVNKTKCTVPTPEDAFCLSNMACTFYGSFLYVAGGTVQDLHSSSGWRPSDEFWEYDCVHNMWSQKPNMSHPRSNFSIVAIEGCVYALGGSYRSGRYDLVEVFELENEAWTDAKPMPYPLSDHCAVALDGKIYVMGGFAGGSRKGITNRALCFDTTVSAWTELPTLMVMKKRASAAVLNGEVYVIGGTDYIEEMDIVEIYNVEKKRWRLGARLPEECCSAGVAVIDGKLYVCGGVRFHQVLDGIWVYNAADDSWERMSGVKLTRQFEFGSTAALINQQRLKTVEGKKT